MTVPIDRRDFLISYSVAATFYPYHLSNREIHAMEEAQPLDRFKAVPRLSLANRHTRIEKCDRLRAALAGAPSLYIKRDDCLGYLVGGNKLRKLEYVMADVRKHQATTVLTVGATTSNHARVTAMVAARLGLKCILVLNGVDADKATANLRVDRLMGAEIHYVRTREQRNALMAELSRNLEKKGERVYQVPLGSSDHVGSFGFVAALEEVQRQQRDLGVRFNAIVFASASGGTQAGQEVGKRLFRWNDLQVIGVNPDGTSDEVKGYVLNAANPMLAQLGLPEIRDRAEVTVDDTQVGGGYRVASEQSKEAEALFLRTEGILLDPVYTAKAAAGLIDYCRQKKFSANDNVLFWHTGGLIALFE